MAGAAGSLAARYLKRQIQEDLTRKMVFLMGPRQVGKTTLARSLPGAAKGYLNWDVEKDRRRILDREFPESDLWVLDEIHKHRPWRALLKGLWDGRRTGQRIMVIGSARLDLYGRGGDSLQGRYHLLRLHPLSVAELGITAGSDLEALLELSGFPEPWFSGSKTEARRWSREYRTRLVRGEVADLERFEDLDSIERMMQRLPELVGSPLSINALREDLGVSHKTAAKWLDALERLFAIVRIHPLAGPKIRAVKKERKHYHFDWSVVPEPGPRFENLVAMHLLKWVHREQDVEGRDLDLVYFRDTDGREVDFVVTDRRKPILLVETKLGDGARDKSLRYLKERYPSAEAWQIHARGTKDFVTEEGIRVAPAIALLSRLA